MESESTKQVTIHESEDSNESQNSSSPNNDEHKNPGRKKRSWSGLLAGVAFLFAVMAALISFWSMNKSIQSVNTLKSTVAEKDRLLSQNREEIDRLLKNQRSLRDDLESRIAATKQEQNNLDKSFKRLGESLDSLGQRVGKNTTTWIVAEAEYLLTVANHRILLERDVPTAVEALVAADQRLKKVGDPALFRVRKLITDEVSALKSVSEPDLSGMVFELTTLASIIQELPLVITEKSKEIEKPLTLDQSDDLTNAFSKLWEDIKGLVVVRRHDQPVTPLLPPDQRQFLMQNLRLKVESARLAILRLDPTNFKSNLSEAKNWLESYFDVSDGGVIRFNQTLDRLLLVNIEPELPPISGSLRALQSIRSQGEASKTTLLIPEKLTPKKQENRAAEVKIVNDNDKEAIKDTTKSEFSLSPPESGKESLL